jgi:DNA-binding GntR family transcriptional regulator
MKRLVSEMSVVPAPLYYWVKLAIQQEIEAGQLQSRSLLPLERVLCHCFDNSNAIIRGH